MARVVLPYTPRKQFHSLHSNHGSTYRYGIAVCHRRAGKTVAAIRHLERAALQCDKKNPQYGYVCPQLKQAKAVAWKYVQDGAGPLVKYGAKINQSELKVTYPNGGELRLFGGDHPDSLRGLYFDGVVLDEFADMKPDLRTSVLIPALSDRQGWELIIGTPKGRDAFYQVWREAQKRPDDYFSLMLKASETGLIPADELAKAREAMSEAEYNREYECSFDEPGVAQFIESKDCDAAVQRDVARGQPVVIGVDVARFGDDQSCIVVRYGDAVVDIQRFRGLDTMQFVGHIATEVEQHSPQQVFVDGVGVGGPVVDRLRQLGHKVVDVSAGAKATNDARYFNLRAEMWARMRDWIRSRGMIPRDQGLIDDLTAPTYEFDPSNRIKLEKKEDMKKRGLASPDAGDALAMTFAYPVQVRPEWRERAGGVMVKTGNPRLDRKRSGRTRGPRRIFA